MKLLLLISILIQHKNLPLLSLPLLTILILILANQEVSNSLFLEVIMSRLIQTRKKKYPIYFIIQTVSIIMKIAKWMMKMIWMWIIICMKKSKKKKFLIIICSNNIFNSNECLIHLVPSDKNSLLSHRHPNRLFLDYSNNQIMMWDSKLLKKCKVILVKLIQILIILIHKGLQVLLLLCRNSSSIIMYHKLLIWDWGLDLSYKKDLFLIPLLMPDPQ